MIGPYELNQVITGHCLDALKGIPDGVVHATITSPPYFGHRDYGLEPVVWPAVTFRPAVGLPEITIPKQACCLGLESDPWAYVAHLVLVFREVHRVLRDDGALWLNLGDSFAQSGGSRKYGSYGGGVGRAEAPGGKRKPPKGLQPKNLLGIPWMVAKALQADGWILRADCPWIKANPMPDSNLNRPGISHEYIFMLTKTGRNYFDMEAVKKPIADSRNGNPGKYNRTPNSSKGANNDRSDLGFLNNGGGWNTEGEATGRHRRTGDWFTESLQETIDYLTTIRDKGGLMLDEEGDPLVLLVNPVGYKGGHFATFSPKLVEPMVLASTSEHGVCASCGSPWKRIIEKIGKSIPVEERHGRTGHNGQPPQISGNYWTGPTTKATGEWQPTCNCDAEVVPAVVLDPFMGSGTTAKVALGNRRNFIGIDANPTYATELVPERLNGTQIKLLEA